MRRCAPPSRLALRMRVCAQTYGARRWEICAILDFLLVFTVLASDVSCGRRICERYIEVYSFIYDRDVCSIIVINIWSHEEYQGVRALLIYSHIHMVGTIYAWYTHNFSFLEGYSNGLSSRAGMNHYCITSHINRRDSLLGPLQTFVCPQLPCDRNATRSPYHSSIGCAAHLYQ